MKKISFFLFSLFFVSDLLACPYCAGSMQDGKDSNTTLVLSLFIIAIYIPFWMIYRLVKKHRALEQSNDASRSSDT